MTATVGPQARGDRPPPGPVPLAPAAAIPVGGNGSPVDRTLAPVRAALLVAADADAAAALAAADAEAAATVSAAREQAAELVARARAEGTADAAAMLAADRARGQREARRIVLAARREAVELLRQRARAAVATLRTEPGSDRLADGLARHARALLGPDAVLAAHPDGGVVATAPGRRCDLSLPALADRAVESLGPEVERLWTP